MRKLNWIRVTSALIAGGWVIALTPGTPVMAGTLPSTDAPPVSKTQSVYFDTSTTGVSVGGGSAPGGSSFPGISGVSTSAMQTPSTFTNAGWSTSNWTFYNGQYPLLAWQVPLTMSTLANPTTVGPAGQVTVTGTVYSSAGSPLSAMNVTLSDNAGGSWQKSVITTDASGAFTDSWTAPSGTTTAMLTAAVQGANVQSQSTVQVEAYTVTYNGNGNTGGTVPTDSNTYTIGSSATVLGNTGTLTKTGYTFAGWNTKADGSGTSYSAGNALTIGAANGTLYAKWTANVVPFSVGTNFVWNGQYRVPYVPLQLQAVSGYGPYTWSVVSGSMPSGLTLSTDGLISGIPTGPDGTSTFTVQATDASGQRATKAISILIAGAPALAVTTTSLPEGHVGDDYSAQLRATGVNPMTWTLMSGTLPTGLNLDPSGYLSGTPTQSGMFPFTIQVTDASGVSVQVTLTLDVKPLGQNERLITWNGDTHTVPAFVRDNTTYMPIWYVMQYLKQMGIQSTWDGQNWRMITQSTPNFVGVHVGTGSTSMYLNGTLVQKVNTVAAMDPSTGGTPRTCPSGMSCNCCNEWGSRAHGTV